MPLKPQKRTFDTDLPDWRTDPANAWILLRVLSPIQAQKSQQDADKEVVDITFEVLTEPWASRDPRVKTKQRTGLTVNPTGEGTAAKLAQLINATQSADLTKNELYDFDLETLPDSVVEACGEIKESEAGRFWRVKAYRRPQQRPVAAA